MFSGEPGFPQTFRSKTAGIHRLGRGVHNISTRGGGTTDPEICLLCIGTKRDAPHFAEQRKTRRLPRGKDAGRGSPCYGRGKERVNCVPRPGWDSTVISPP